MHRSSQKFEYTPKPLQRAISIYEPEVFAIYQEVLEEKQLRHDHVDSLEEAIAGTVTEILERIWELALYPTAPEIEEMYEQSFGYFHDFAEKKIREGHYFRIFVMPDVLDRLQALSEWFFTNLESNLAF